MVITPQKLKQRIEKDESDALERLEKKIDEALTKGFNGQSATMYLEPECNQLRSFVLDRLLDRYRVAGWNIRHHYDQRDGDFYEFSTKIKEDQWGDQWDR